MRSHTRIFFHFKWYFPIMSLIMLIWFGMTLLSLIWGKQWVQDFSLAPSMLRGPGRERCSLHLAKAFHWLGHELYESRDRPSAHLCIQPVCDTANTCLLSRINKPNFQIEAIHSQGVAEGDYNCTVRRGNDNKSLSAKTLYRALLLLVLPAECRKGWMTPPLCSLRSHLNLIHLEYCPETSVMFPSWRGALQTQVPLPFFRKGRKPAPVTFEKKPPLPGGLGEAGYRGEGLATLHLPAPRLSPPNRAWGDRLSRGRPTRANSLPWIRRRRQMRQNEKYNDAYYINHPPFFWHDKSSL